eukprot:s211_g14.t1
MPAAEAARATEILRSADDVNDVDGGGKISANVFHTRLVDTYSSRFRTEVFQVRYSKIDGGVGHLIGLRDFTDQLSLAGQPRLTKQWGAPRGDAADGGTPQRHGRDSGTTSREQKPQDRLVPLEDMVVNSASASLAQTVFTSDGVELFRNAQQQLVALEEQETLEETTLYFGSLGLRWGDSVQQISGTMEPTWSRKGKLRLVLCFQLSPASTDSALPECAAAAMPAGPAMPASSMSAPQETLRTLPLPRPLAL